MTPSSGDNFAREKVPARTCSAPFPDLLAGFSLSALTLLAEFFAGFVCRLLTLGASPGHFQPGLKQQKNSMDAVIAQRCYACASAMELRMGSIHQ
jgi:hypothetical protein